MIVNEHGLKAHALPVSRQTKARSFRTSAPSEERGDRKVVVAWRLPIEDAFTELKIASRYLAIVSFAGARLKKMTDRKNANPDSLVWVNAKKISNFVQNISMLSFTLIIERVDLSEWSEEGENILNKKGADEAKDEPIINQVC